MKIVTNCKHSHFCPLEKMYKNTQTITTTYAEFIKQVNQPQEDTQLITIMWNTLENLYQQS